MIPILIRCGWCGKDMGKKQPMEDESITHGICEDCLAELMQELEQEESGQEAR